MDLRGGKACARHSRGIRAGVGRIEVPVCVVGDGACGWMEAASVWGATVEVVVHQDKHNHGIHELLSLPRSMGADAAAERWPAEVWPGVLLATVRSPGGGLLVGRFLELWRPLGGVLAIPVELSRGEYDTTWRGTLGDLVWQVVRFVLSHAKLGGVTESWWHFLVFR